MVDINELVIEINELNDWKSIISMVQINKSMITNNESMIWYESCNDWNQWFKMIKNQQINDWN